MGVASCLSVLRGYLYSYPHYLGLVQCQVESLFVSQTEVRNTVLSMWHTKINQSYEELLTKSDPLSRKFYYVLTSVILHSGRGSVVAWYDLYVFWKVMTTHKGLIPSEINLKQACLHY